MPNKLSPNLSDIALQIFTLSATNKQNLGPLSDSSLHEAFCSALINVEEKPIDQKLKIILTGSKTMSNLSAIEIAVDFILAVVAAGPSHPNSILLARLISHILIEQSNLALYGDLVKGLLKILENNENSCCKIASLECLCTLLTNKFVTSSVVFRTNEIFDSFYKQLKSSAQIRSSLFKALEALILGVKFGSKLSQVNENLVKFIKYWFGINEKSITSRTSAYKLISTWLPYASVSSAAITMIQSNLLKELGFSPAVGHTFGILLFVGLKENLIQGNETKAQQKAQSDPQGVLAIKEFKTLDSILLYLETIWSKFCNYREQRESLTRAYVSFLNNFSFDFVQQNSEKILFYILKLVSKPISNSYAPNKIVNQVKSNMSYILRSGVIFACTEEGKKSIAKQILNLISINLVTNSKDVDLIALSFLLAEFYSILAEVGESIIDLGPQIEQTIMSTIKFQQESKTEIESHSVWVWAGLILKRYPILNDQYCFTIKLLQSCLPQPVGSCPSTTNPLPAAWAFVCANKTRPFCNETEFKQLNLIAQNLTNATISLQSSYKTYWTQSCWLIISYLFLTGESFESESQRRQIIYQNLNNFQDFWKQELSVKSCDESDIVAFAKDKLFLLFSLKLFLINFSDLVHNSNLTTFITQCLNTVLQTLKVWLSKYQAEKSKRNQISIDALILALFEAYEALDLHLSKFTPSTNSDLFPSRSILQIISKLLPKPHFVLTTYFLNSHLNLQDEIVNNEEIPMAGFEASTFDLYEDFHSFSSNFASVTRILWQDWTWPPMCVGFKENDQVCSTRAKFQFVKSETGPVYQSSTNQLLIHMIDGFTNLFQRQQLAHQSELIQYFQDLVQSKYSDVHIHSKILFVFLSIVKSNARISNQSMGSFLSWSVTSKPLNISILNQIISISKKFSTSSQSLHRRIASEIVAFVVDANENELLASTFRNLQQTLTNLSSSQTLNSLIKEESNLCSNMFTLASIHRIVGGIRTRKYLPETIKVFLALLRTTLESNQSNKVNLLNSHINIHKTALHCLWIVLEATGLSDTSFIESTLGLLIETLISDTSMMWQTTCLLAKIIGSIVQALGPELQASLDLLLKFQSALFLLETLGELQVSYLPYTYNAAASPLSNDWIFPKSWDLNSLILDATITLRGRIILFVPQSIDYQNSTNKLLKYLTSLQRNCDYTDGSKYCDFGSPINMTRLNCIQILILISQLFPQVFQSNAVIRSLLFTSELEPIHSLVRLEALKLIHSLKDANDSTFAKKWLNFTFEFALASSIEIPNSQSTLNPKFEKNKTNNPDESVQEEEEEEMGRINIFESSKKSPITKEQDESLWKFSSSTITIFTFDLCHILYPLRFDIDFKLDQKLEDLVSLACKSSFGKTYLQQASGLEAIHVILKIFSESEDQDLQGHFLLELYIAQLNAAIRSCISKESHLYKRIGSFSYIVSAQIILWISEHVKDQSAIRQLVKPFLDFKSELGILEDQSEAVSDSKYSLNLESNPRIVAWLLASSILWTQAQLINSKRFGAQDEPSFLWEIYLTNKSLQFELRKGWLQLLETNAYQLFSNNVIIKKSNIFEANSVGGSWLDILIASSLQLSDYFLDFASIEVDVEKLNLQFKTKFDLIFGLVLSNLSNFQNIYKSLVSFKNLFNSLINLKAHAKFLFSEFPLYSIIELVNFLCTLLPLLNEQPINTKIIFLETVTLVITYVSSFKNPSDPSLPYFTSNETLDIRNTLINDFWIETLQCDSNACPSTKHTPVYINSLLKSIVSSWPLLNPSQVQNSFLCIWLINLVLSKRFDHQKLIFPVALECFSMLIDSNLPSFVEATINSIENIIIAMKENEQDEEWCLKIKWFLDALFTISFQIKIDSNDHSIWVHQKIISILKTPQFIQSGLVSACFFPFAQKFHQVQTFPIDILKTYFSFLLPSILATTIPTINSNSFSQQKIDHFHLIIKLLSILQKIQTSSSIMLLFVSSLVTFLYLKDSPPTSDLYNTALQILIHFAQSNSNFKQIMEQLSDFQKNTFENAIRLSVQKQKTQIQINLKPKFSLDTSKYSK